MPVCVGPGGVTVVVEVRMVMVETVSVVLTQQYVSCSLVVSYGLLQLKAKVLVQF